MRSPFQALTSAKSAVRARSSRYCAAVELAHFLAFGDHRADAGGRVERRDARAAGADLLGERPLRDQLHIQRAREHHFFQPPVFADVASDVRSDHARPRASAPCRSRRCRHCWRWCAGPVTFLRTSAAIRFSGTPHNPKPPIMMLAPSAMSATAASELATTLFTGHQYNDGGGFRADFEICPSFRSRRARLTY